MIIVLSNVVWGQSYRITLDNLHYTMEERTQRGSTNSRIIIKINYNDKTKDILYNRPLPNGGYHHESGSYKIILITNKKPTHISYDVFINWKNGNHAKITEYDSSRYKYLKLCDRLTINEDFSFKLSNFKYNIEITPIIELKPVNPDFHIIGYSDEKIISVTEESKGFSSNDYHWEYQLVDYKNGEKLSNDKWMSIPNYANFSDNLKIKPSDFLPNSSIGKRIYFRIKTCNNTTEPIWYEIRKSAPHISSSQVFPTKCFDSKDGSVLINFDRKLLPNESLEYILKYSDTDTGAGRGDISKILQNSTSLTLNNIPAGRYKLDFIGNYLGNASYTDGAAHSFNFEVTNPPAVTFDATHKNVYCHEGSDGEISITASGGQGNFQYFITKNGLPFADWTNFNNGNSATIKNLDAGTYAIKVRDTNFCTAKSSTNSSQEKEVTLNITQPENPIALSEIETFTPTGYGLSNGYISVRVTGGTPNSDGSYFYEWRKNAPDGEIITSNIITDNTNQPFTIKLGNIPAGTYYLTVKDKNYSVATSNLNHCGIISKVFNVSQPDPLIVNIKVQEVISCNINNNYRSKNDHNQNNIPDEAEDGVLFADVKGGVKNYFYQWQISNGGVFQNIPNATENKLANLSEGTYKVLIKDKNNNTTEAVYTLSYPEELKLNITANTISCYNGNSGILSALVTGGTGNYSYQWSNGETTPTIKNLPADKYTLLITDGKGCNVYGKTEIKQSSEIIITDISVKNPTCYGANNGEIKVSISGGKLPYFIKWSNNATTEHLSNIGAGTYTLIVTDANGCSISKKYTLSQPDALTIDLGQDITLCSGDSQSYDVTIDDPLATYQWLDQNGNTISTSAKINISNAGTYTVIITNVNGCQATDSVVIKNSLDVLNPHFLVSTHSYTDSSVILVNTSEPKPQSVEWIVPNDSDIQVVNKNNDYLELQFSTPGSYAIGLKGNQGECSKILYKNIIVENNNSGIDTKPNKASNIQDFNILPNPNKGIFEVLVNLYQEKSIKIRILDMLSRPISVEIAKSANKKFVIPYNISIPAGNYIVILEAGDEVLVKRMIVHQ